MPWRTGTYAPQVVAIHNARPIADRDLGLTIGEIFDFEKLASDCKQDRRYTCFFVAPPLRVTGAVGSPLNPLAIK